MDATARLGHRGPAIAERCLNHSMGKLTATYDTGKYLAQRREAMDKLGKLVAAGHAPVA